MNKYFLAAVYILVAMVENAEAYLDPGTGSYVLQLAIAGIASAFFAIKVFWRKIVVFISNFFKNKK